MSTLTPWLLAIALGWSSPRAADDEPPAERAARLHVAAAAVAWAVDRAVMAGLLPGRERRLWAALAMATVRRESGLDRRVHEGSRLGDEGRSICFAQINRGNPLAYPPGEWQSLAGVDDESSRRCAWGLVSTFARSRAYCARELDGSALHGAVLSQYLRGHGCRLNDEGRVRLALARRVLSAYEGE